MKFTEKELIEHIGESLKAHEEQYVSGAWEDFISREEKKSRTGLIWWPASAAAILLMGLGLFLYTGKTEKNGGITENQLGHQKTETGSVTGSEIKKDLADGIKKTGKKYVGPTERKGTKIQQIVISEGNTGTGELVPLSLVNSKSLRPLIVNKTIKTGIQPVAQEQFSNMSLSNNLPWVALPMLPEEPIASAKSSPKNEKWEMSLVVAPSFGNAKKMNIGYGISMAYALNDKIALNSGITYASLNAAKINESDVQAAGTRSLESTDANIKGLDVPLELKYSISKSIYANVGISALTVLDHKQDNNYVSERIKQTTVINPYGLSESRAFVVKEKTKEKVPENQLSNDKFIGFYNFSVGFKQKISERKALFVEPFLKVPMKDFSKENINLMDGGLRLRVNF